MFRFHYVALLATVLENFGKGKTLDLPAYQRGFEKFDDDARDELVRTVLDGGYLPPVLIRYREDDRTLPERLRDDFLAARGFAEDGQRRMTTLRMFLNGDFALGARKKRTERGVRYPAVRGLFFAELTPAEQAAFRNYDLHIEAYLGATDEEAVRTFRNVNRGSLKLSMGEVMGAQLHHMPLAVLACEVLLDAEGDELYWGGGRTAYSKRGSDLANATATLAGIAYGSTYFNEKEKLLFSVACREITAEMRETIRHRIGLLREIWQALAPKPKDTLASNWNFTKFNAFILTAIEESDVPLETQKAHWVRFITECRENKALYKDVLGGLGGTHATPRWWTGGWEKVFALYA